MSDLISRQRVRFELVESTMPQKYRDFCARVIDDENLVPSKNKVYPVFLRYVVGGPQDVLQRIFTSEKAAKEFCKIPEGEKPSGLCYLRYEEWELSE